MTVKECYQQMGADYEGEVRFLLRNLQRNFWMMEAFRA